MSAALDVPEGYKLTEVGVIPGDWIPTTIGEVVSFSGGSQPPRSTFRFAPTRDYIRLIQIRDYKSDAFETYIPSSLARKFCTVDDVMIGRYGPPVFQILKGIDGAYNVALIKTDPSDRIELDYMFYILKQDKLFQMIDAMSRRSSGQTGVEMPALKGYGLPLPPRPEQRAIATALSDVDALLAKLDQLIAKKRDLKQAAMQQLLTGQTRLPGFSGEWEVKRLGDVADIDPENLSSSTSPQYSFKYISLEDVDSGSLKSHSEQVFSTSPSRARRKLQVGDVLVSTVRPNLMSHLLFQENGEDWICSTGFAVVRCHKEKANCGFFFAHMFGRLISRQIETLVTGSNYPAINSRDVRAFELLMPSYAEQTAIATVLSDMDTELAALEARRDKTRALKQGMMQALLTGRIRLV